jgi:chorismate synthase
METALSNQDRVGGLIECKVNNIPIGLGEPFFDSVESLVAHAIFSIPAVKGIEFGAGFAAAKMVGSEHNDSIISNQGHTATNHAGGVSGGLSNGNELIFRVAIKPTSSTPKQQESLNIDSGKVETFTIQGRHDLCIALRIPVVVEAVTAIVLADLLLLDQKISRVRG